MFHVDLVAHLLIQILAILVTCKAVGFVGTRLFMQTEVVCEMTAGVILGPSLLGLIAPQTQQWLFPIQKYILSDGQTTSYPSMTIVTTLMTSPFLNRIYSNRSNAYII
jgi:hypothetical protein